MPNFKIVARKDSAELFLYDVIGEGFFGGIGSKAVIDALNHAAGVKTLNVRINSPGGDVFEGFAIYNALNRFPARVEVDIDAEACSIASYVAMAGSVIRIAENARMMIHNPISGAAGESLALRRRADEMDAAKDNLVQAYAKRTGQKPETISGWMNKTTYFSSRDAVTNGFADQVDQPLRMAACDSPIAQMWISVPFKSATPATPMADVRRSGIARIEKRFASLQ